MGIERPKAWFGADPGGVEKFGVALLRDTAGSTPHAFRARTKRCDWLVDVRADIAAAAIDAPLWWSSGKSGDRKADGYLRKTYKNPSGTVQATNSLRGAALIEGVMLAWRLREHLPELPITEAHPKALLKALISRGVGRDVAERFGLRSIEPGADHERDAIIAAVAAREGSVGDWDRDLTLDRAECRARPRCSPMGSGPLLVAESVCAATKYRVRNDKCIYMF